MEQALLYSIWQDLSRTAGRCFLVAAAFFIPISVTLADISYVSAVVCVLLSGECYEQRELLFRHPISLCFWAFLALYLIGLTYTVGQPAEVWHDLYKHHWILCTPFLMILVTQENLRRYMINAFLAAMILTLGLSYLKGWGWDIVNKGYLGVSVFFAHIVQNFLMAYAAALIAYRILYHARWRWLNILLFGLMSFNIVFMSRGRTGYIIYAALIIFALFYRYRWRGLVAAIVLMGLLFTLAFNFSTSFHSRVLHSIHSNSLFFQRGQSHTSLGLRLAMWQNSIHLIKERPWLGYGTGGILNAYKALSPQAIARSGLVNAVEIGYLNILLKFGMLGFMVLMGIFACQWYYSFRLDPQSRFTIQAFLIGYLLGNVANPFLLSSTEAHFYSILCAALFSALPRQTRANQELN